MEKSKLSERDICSKFITPAILKAGWRQDQFREEVKLTDGRVMVRGQLAARVKNPDAKGGPKRADYVLYSRPHMPDLTLDQIHSALACYWDHQEEIDKDIENRLQRVDEMPSRQNRQPKIVARLKSKGLI